MGIAEVLIRLRSLVRVQDGPLDNSSIVLFVSVVGNLTHWND